MDLAKNVFDLATRMNRTVAAQVAPQTDPTTVHAVFLGDRLLGLYRKEEKAIVVAHQIRLSDIYAGLTWQKVTHAHSGKQVWTCDVHGETITLTIEPRKVD